jgi:2',3'-cyclic-nucleotide 2'-phosphodiesterase (5'-nucleotidase family)
VTVSVIGTNDLHGRIDTLPLLAGYVDNIRAARARDGGGVVLVDAGDMFQGTLESNLGEGAAVVDAFAAMGFTAVTVGNHEFDYGPVGEPATPERPGDDPRGALKALAKRAPFPFLLANTLDRATGRRVAWPNMPATALVTVAGVKVGLVGVSTKDTLTTTIAANVSDLAMAPLADTIAREARALRAEGAAVVVALAHAGGECARFTGDFARDGCVEGAEIVEVARAVPDGLVDVIVAGHTHAGLAHAIGGEAVVEAFAYGRAFDRVDLVVEGEPPRVTRRTIEAPRDLCAGDPKASRAACDPGDYEGAPVARNERVATALAPAIEAARGKRSQPVGVALDGPVTRDYDDESPLGNLFADLLREATGADVAVTNGGGLRADLPAGPLTFGALYEAFPFDNRVAKVRLTAAALRGVLAAHLARGGGILSLSGVALTARCGAAGIEIALDCNGSTLSDDTVLTVAGSDFLFAGGDEFWGGSPPPEGVVIDRERVRDALVRSLKQRGAIRAGELLDPKRPRLALPARRPLACPAK